MRVVVAGGHGKVALLLERLLAGRGDQAVGLIRNPAQAADVRNAGADGVVCDLEAASAEDVAGLLSGADAVVFAAGAACGSLPPSPPPSAPLDHQGRVNIHPEPEDQFSGGTDTPARIAMRTVAREVRSSLGGSRCGSRMRTRRSKPQAISSFRHVCEQGE
jgi:NAD(P)-dependent dehydrogenase (short-subunit alcohol dehydrogenase family)